mmetsp:Transcript_28663/g.44023  ORF Transcript_28663/g.44023 Transcript_28663/m.44023 type:complete len:150 (+) Transcript_28663:90-539(+)
MKMMKQTVAMLLLSTPSVAAWGHQYKLQRPAFATHRLASKDDSSEAIDAFRQILEDSFSLSEETYDDYFEPNIDSDEDRVILDPLDNSIPVQMYRDDWFDGQWLARACGEDCEQCEIPEDYKILPAPKVDVMAFLGIKRAEPIQSDGKN